MCKFWPEGNIGNKGQILGILKCALSQCVVICRVKMRSIHVQGSKCAISQVTVLSQLLFVAMYRFEPYWHLSLPVRAAGQRPLGVVTSSDLSTL